MYPIADHHIEYILMDLDARGIKTPDLQQNLVDHICIMIERDLEVEEDFKSYYESVLPSFYREEMAEIEAETNFLLQHRGALLLLSRPQFLFCLFLLLVGPFIGVDLAWLVRIGPANGYNIPLDIWGGSLVYSLFPLLIWLVLAFTPDRFDPLLPKGAKVLLGWRPFISIL
jgi:hypothetical protein